ncbi:hypothetical protein Q5X42_05030 [Acinetobacter baumannii]|nr:hypothetical protein [Acinetobacter baumannii]
MEINKENMFEKFFEGFQAKFIEAFKASGEEKILIGILENQKASKEEYRTYFNCAWEFLQTTEIASQQAKVEELQKRVESLEKHLKPCECGSKEICVDQEGYITKHCYRCGGIKSQEMIEQALKGEG